MRPGQLKLIVAVLCFFSQISEGAAIFIGDTSIPIINVVIQEPCDGFVLDTSISACTGYNELCASARIGTFPDSSLNFSYRIDAYSDGIGRFGDFDYYVGRLTPAEASQNTFLVQGLDDCEVYNVKGYCNPFATDASQPFCATGRYPIGTHTVYWSVEDSCGTTVIDTSTFISQDCEPPVFSCTTDIVEFVLPVSGELCIQALDIAFGSTDNCTDSIGMKYYFNGNTEVTSYCVSCDTFEARGADDRVFLDLELWIEDEEGNTNSCVVTLEVKDKNDVCPSDWGISISGSIKNALTQENVEKAEIYLDSRKKFETTSDGRYYIPWVNKNDALKTVISAQRNDDILNGVSTADLIGILRHLLGIQEFKSGYQMIAGDVNNDQRVSAADIAAILKVILGKIENLNQWNDQKSWRFIDAKQILMDNLSPWPFNEVISGSDVAPNYYDLDFDAVKIGDINGDAENNGITKNDEREKPEFKIYGNASNITTENTYVMELWADEDIDLSGLQMTLEFDIDQLNLKEVKSGKLDVSMANFGNPNGDSGLMPMLWYEGKGESVNIMKGDRLFTMKFNVVKNASLSNILDINDKIISSEVYNSELEVFNLNFSMTSSGGHSNIELLQNVPNPFNGETIIGFNATVSGYCRLIVFNPLGQIVLTDMINAQRGYNSIVLYDEYFTEAGIYCYQLIKDGHAVTKKMIITH